jgi:CBS domain-containing protein
MCRIHELVAGLPLHCANASQTVMEVARMMVENNIGAVPVLRDNMLIGIFSERDLMRRVVVEGRDPNSVKVCEVMTPEPRTVAPDQETEECMRLMRDHGFRHLPICQDGVVHGMVSLRDILLRDLIDKDDEVRMMRAYITAGPEL